MRKNKFLAISASVLALMPIGTPRVLAEEPVATVALEDSKSAEIKYNVDQVYEWNIHSGIDFGKNRGVNQNVSVKSNLVSVTKNVLEEGNKLVIKVKGSGDGNGFTISNGGKEKLSYSINDGTKDLGVNGTVLEVPAGTNEGTKNLEFKLKTADKKAEIAGIYNGVVTYTAEINGGGDSTTGDAIQAINTGKKIKIDDKEYFVIECSDTSRCKLLAGYPVAENQAWGSNNNRYKDSQLAKDLDTVYFEKMTENIKKAIVETNVTQSAVIGTDNSDRDKLIYSEETENSGPHKLFLPSYEEVFTVVKAIGPEAIMKRFPDLFWFIDAFEKLGGEISLNVALEGGQTTSFDIAPALVVNLKKVNSNALDTECKHSYVWRFDESTHWKQCGDCGDKIEFSSHKYIQRFDENSHWKECSVCGDKIEFSSHKASDWIIDTAATETATGSKHKQCTVCGRVLKTVEIPATGLNGVTTGKVLEIEGKEYTVIEQVEGKKYKVLATDIISNIAIDKGGSNSYYSSSTTPVYLNNDYYNKLPKKIKDAIVPISIQQKDIANYSKTSPFVVKYNESQTRNFGTHKIFVPSWDEVSKVYGNTEEGMKKYTSNINTWLRDRFSNMYVLAVSGYSFSLFNSDASSTYLSVRPAFVLDLSKVNYTIK